MNHKHFRPFALILCLTLVLLAFTGCAHPLAKEAKDLERGQFSLRIAAGPEGSEEKALADALAKLLKDAGYGATVLVTEGPVQNVTNLTEYKADLAIVSADDLTAAVNGTGDFSGKAQNNLHALMSLGVSGDGSRNVLLCSDDTMDAMAWDMLSCIAKSLGSLQAACKDGSEITMENGSSDIPVALNDGAAAYFDKKPWTK